MTITYFAGQCLASLIYTEIYKTGGKEIGKEGCFSHQW